MANENICIFCGEKLGVFRSSGIICAGTYQPCCKSRSKDLKELSEEEQCRRALRLGLALQPGKLEARIDLITKAEEHRPSCRHCGSKMKFDSVQYFDNSPMRDSILSDGFEILPAYCESCGRYEFYKPSIVNKNKFIVYLIEKDTANE